MNIAILNAQLKLKHYLRKERWKAVLPWPFKIFHFLTFPVFNNAAIYN